MQKTSLPWTRDEVHTLKLHYQDSLDLLKKALPERTTKSILQKVRRLGLRRRDSHDADVKILLRHSSAVIPAKGGNDPTNFCYDCVAVSCEEIKPHIYRYGLGISLQKVTTDPDSRVGFRIAPRSSIWKTGMVLTNSEGIIDEGYTGEISAVFYHVRPELPRYQIGDRVCQLYMQHSRDINFIPVTSLDPTQRGSGREGSTGK